MTTVPSNAMLQTSNSNSVDPPSEYHINSTQSATLDRTANNVATQDPYPIHTFYDKYMPLKKIDIISTAKFSTINNTGGTNSFHIPSSKEKKILPNSIIDKIRASFNGKLNIRTDISKRPINLFIKHSDTLSNFTMLGKIECSLCKKDFRRNKIYQDHLDSFHGTVGKNDLCSPILTNLVRTKRHAIPCHLVHSSSSTSKKSCVTN